MSLHIIILSVRQIRLDEYIVYLFPMFIYSKIETEFIAEKYAMQKPMRIGYSTIPNYTFNVRMVIGRCLK